MGKFKNALIEIREAHERATKKNISRQSDDEEDIFLNKQEYEDYLQFCNEVRQFGDKGGT